MAFSSVIFRVDAGPTEGLGHLQRCLVIASEAKRNQCNVQFVCRSRESRTIDRLKAYPVLCLDEINAAGVSDGSEEWDASATVLAVRSFASTAWVVVDHYGLARAWERAVRESGYNVAVIDDYRYRHHHANLLISDSAAPFDDSLNDEPHAVKLTGPQYTLLGSEYAPTVAPGVTSVKRVLVTYGAADPTGETFKAIEVLGKLVQQGVLGNDVVVDIVVGPLNSEASSVAIAAKAQGQVVHSSPKSLAQLIAQADLVVTAGGTTMVEALVLSRPCVITITADNQALLATQLARQKLITLAGDSSSVGFDRLYAAIESTTQLAVMLAATVAANRPFDLNGAQRIFAAMQAIAPASAVACLKRLT